MNDHVCCGCHEHEFVERMKSLERAIVRAKGLLHCFTYQHAENPAERKALFDQCVKVLDEALYERAKNG